MFLLQQSTHRMLIQYDGDIGHRFVPNLRARIPNENGGYYVVTNSCGFRSDIEFEEPKRIDCPRILMFGDSYTAGDNVSNHGTLFGRLSQAERRGSLQLRNLWNRDRPTSAGRSKVREKRRGRFGCDLCLHRQFSPNSSFASPCCRSCDRQ